jgi:hypothetical protein
VAETTFEPAILNDYLTRHAVRVEQIARTGLKTVIAELGDEVAMSGRRAWLLTESTHLALCLANRTPGVWAVAANNRSELVLARKSIQPNFILTNATQSNWPQLAALAQAYATGNTTT